MGECSRHGWKIFTIFTSAYHILKFRSTLYEDAPKCSIYMQKVRNFLGMQCSPYSDTPFGVSVIPPKWNCGYVPVPYKNCKTDVSPITIVRDIALGWFIWVFKDDRKSNTKTDVICSIYAVTFVTIAAYLCRSYMWNKLFWNTFEIISVFYFTWHHRSWLHLK